MQCNRADPVAFEVFYFLFIFIFIAYYSHLVNTLTVCFHGNLLNIPSRRQRMEGPSFDYIFNN